MASVITNALKVLQAELYRLERARLGQPVIMVGAAELTRNVIAHRIQVDSLNAFGQRLFSTSARRIGAYSSFWGKVRQQEGLQTGRIDLTFTGDMMADWQVMTPARVGFSDNAHNDKADELEEMFGPIFRLSVSEKKQIDLYVDVSIRKLLTGR